MKIKFYTLDIWVDNEKHLFFLADPHQAIGGREVELADIIYKRTGYIVDTKHLTTHEFPDTSALVNFLNANTLHFADEQIDFINKELDMDIWHLHQS
jgi:hypothetical protein